MTKELITVKELEEIKLAGITCKGELGNCDSYYEKLLNWAKENNLTQSPNFKLITIYHDNVQMTAPSEVRWSVCTPIDNNYDTQGYIKTLFIQKGKYAVGHFEITEDLFQQSWNKVVDWIRDNNYEFGTQESFEVYYNDNKTHPEKKFIVDLVIPIK